MFRFVAAAAAFPFGVASWSKSKIYYCAQKLLHFHPLFIVSRYLARTIDETQTKQVPTWYLVLLDIKFYIGPDAYLHVGM